MTNSDLCEAVRGLPDDGLFYHREYVHQTQWDDTDIATYADLKRFVADYERLLAAAKGARDWLAVETGFDLTELQVAIEEADK